MNRITARVGHKISLHAVRSASGGKCRVASAVLLRRSKISALRNVEVDRDVVMWLVTQDMGLMSVGNRRVAVVTVVTVWLVTQDTGLM